MATKRTRTKEPNKAAVLSTDAARPSVSGRIASAPRKRTDAPKADASRSRTDEARGAGSRRGSATSKKPKRRRRRWPFVVIGAVLLLVLLAAGLFSWDRWMRYDDVAEFKGSWQTHGTTAVVVIDGETIKLSEDVAYSYTLDTDAKTIAFTFGNMEGAGRYRFSLDRTQLVIIDGDGYTWFSTLAEDIAWQFDQLARAVQGQPASEPPSGDAVTVLDRLSHDATAAPQTGEPVVAEPEPAPEPTPKTEPESEPSPEPEPEAPPASDENPAPSSDSAGDVFDVSDLPA